MMNQRQTIEFFYIEVLLSKIMENHHKSSF